MTSNELTPRQEQRAADMSLRDTSTDLIEWAAAARQAHIIAQSLAETSFVPRAMHRRPDEVCGAILAGRELGMSPMAALRAIDIIDGTPAMRANAMRGLVQSYGHEVWVEESTEHRAIVCGRRRGASRIERVTWTFDQARKAGLANKRNWQSHPAAMLIARATSQVCRLIASDVLLGMPYAIEELSTDDSAVISPDASGAPQTEVKRTRATARRKATPSADEDLPDVVDSSQAPNEDKARAFGDPNDPIYDKLPFSQDELEAARRIDADEPAPPAEPARVTARVVDDKGDWPEPATIPNEGNAGEGPKGSQGQRPEPMTAVQQRAMHASFRDLDVTDRRERLTFVVKAIGRPIGSSSELTKDEASAVIDVLKAAINLKREGLDVEEVWSDELPPDGP